jgi:hypothetical protein
MEERDAYAARVAGMTPKQVAATLANHEKTKASDRWMLLDAPLREQLEAMAEILRERALTTI